MDGLGVLVFGKFCVLSNSYINLEKLKYSNQNNYHTQGKYSTKTDVWSFGVLLWEILTNCRHSPYPTFSNQEVLNNLRKLSVAEDVDPFKPLTKPQSCPRDIYQLMCDSWSRSDDNRPTFWEIHSFLSRKNLHFTFPNSNHNTGSQCDNASSSLSFTHEPYILSSSGTSAPQHPHSYSTSHRTSASSTSLSGVEHYIV